jgi:tRNA nucleotidyltransferase (CCA-adding enzyme)
VSAASARWEHFAHSADIGIRGIGPSSQTAFAQAGLALTAVMTDPTRVVARDEVVVRCEAPSLEDLFFDWIDALVFEMSTRRMLFGRFDVHIADGRVTGHIWGEPVDRERHTPAVEVKGPTFTELRVECDAERGEWRVQCVVDV